MLCPSVKPHLNHIAYIFDILSSCSKSPKPPKQPKGKQMRVWDMGGSSTKNLDYSERNGDSSANGVEQSQEAQIDAVCTLFPSTLPL